MAFWLHYQFVAMEGMRMDVIYLMLIVVFFTASWALVRLVDRM